MPYAEKDCIEAIQEAQERIGKTPTMSEYKDLDIKPSMTTIRRLLDTWNNAKKEANLETIPENKNRDRGPRLDTHEDISEQKWRDMSSYQRHYYYNKDEILEKNTRLKREKQKWFRNYKKDLKCKECGEGHPAALSFHHRNPDKKEHEVSTMPNNGYAIETIRQEIEKCDVLCRNCHAKKHHKGD